VTAIRLSGRPRVEKIPNSNNIFANLAMAQQQGAQQINSEKGKYPPAQTQIG
jgi:hypothetical protein